MAPYQLRPYSPEDLEALLRLFYESVHRTACADYTTEQLDAWAPEAPDQHVWKKKFSTTETWVVEKNGVPVGFANREKDYFDCLYVAPAHQCRGVAAMLAEAVEQAAAREGITRLTVEASRPARRFFEKRGYRILRAQRVERRGQTLENFVMEREMCRNV